MEGILATIGGILFFLSWVLQTWETKKRGKPTVSLNFFLIRLVGSILLIIESIRIKSFGFILVTFGTTLMIIYNMMICIIPGKHKKKAS